MGPESVKQSKDASPVHEPPEALFGTPPSDDMNWVFFGSQGLRAGWSLLIFGFLLFVLAPVFGTFLSFLVFDVKKLTIVSGSPLNTILGEGEWVAALLAATLVIAALERRRVADYNLAGPKRLSLFLGGLAAGFIAVSVLIGILSQGGWVHFGPLGLSGMHIFKYAFLWGLAFVLVALFEEGTFRCYLLSTFTRGINFWWALASVGSICLWLALTSRGHGTFGVYVVATAGLFPCLYLEWSKSPQSGFWQAAWVTSVGFGFIHTFNNGENWIGVLAASAIGFVFCVSIRITGSAWWAIGCHTAWDWAESYFYGTADSGFAARGHLMTTVPAGSPLWSGGADGPEGSVLVFPVMLLLLMALYVLYGRQNRAAASQRAARPLAG
jgi:membrane protease YdiL (CAAX protease family)